MKGFNKHIEIETNLDTLDKKQLISLLESVLTEIEDVAYAYDICDDVCNAISTALNDNWISHKMVEEEI